MLMSNPSVKFPKAKVKLVGTDGNAFSIMGKVSTGLRKAGAADADIESFMNEAMSGDYDNVLVTAMRWADGS